MVVLSYISPLVLSLPWFLSLQPCPVSPEDEFAMFFNEAKKKVRENTHETTGCFMHECVHAVAVGVPAFGHFWFYAKQAKEIQLWVKAISAWSCASTANRDKLSILTFLLWCNSSPASPLHYLCLPFSCKRTSTGLTLLPAGPVFPGDPIKPSSPWGLEKE